MAWVRFRKKSGWSYETSATQAGGFGMASGSKGYLIFRSPNGGRFVFNYAAGGVSIGEGFPINLAVSIQAMPSIGAIYLLDTFPAAELTSRDFLGVTLIHDTSIGAGFGGSLDIMLLGVPLASLPREVLKLALPKGIAGAPGIDYVLPSAGGPIGAALAARRLPHTIVGGAKAALVMAGSNLGPQLQIGVSGTVGLVYDAGETVDSVVRRVMHQAGIKPE